MDPISIISMALPLVMKFAPSMLNLFAGPTAGSAAIKVLDAARGVFGTTDLKAIELQIEQEKGKVEQFKARLNAETEELRAYLADVQSSREMLNTAVRASSPIQWVSVALSAAIIGIFALAFYLAIMERISPANVAAQQMFGAIIAAFASVISFWLGSSKGSDDKTTMISGAMAALQSQAARMSSRVVDMAATTATTANGHTPSPQPLFK